MAQSTFPSSYVVPQAATPSTTPTEDDGTCAACPHPLSAHDRIGLRFCSATTAGTSDRGCVCRL
ncbi:RGCVC family protein [Trujillonella endophytica]|uniref:Uncharacterized protein n=1 Tax=Trujillonella endophytica TaxID=673521 RepID=A0A1H8Q2Z7_9ACTN|nr:RGCVC family protein [Trujillella endophytica]SEO48287.1 hypothetical protein SAMN05660991_00527 [Trujillella endophytica]